MFKRLISIFILIFSINSFAKTEPIFFEKIESAKAWFSNNYPGYWMEENAVEGASIYSFYGPKGSGIVRLDAYFYICAEKVECQLLGMKSSIKPESLKEKVKIYSKNSEIFIEAKDNFLFRFK